MTPRGNSDDDDQDETPPLGVFADFQVQKAFASVFRRIESAREELMGEIRRVETGADKWIEEFRKRSHELGNTINGARGEIATHVVEDQGLHRFIQEKMTSFERSLGEIKAHAEKESNAASGWWKWALGTVFTVAVMVIAAWITLTNKITTLESDQSYTREKIRDVGSALDELEDKIDSMSDKLTRGGTQ